MSEPRHKHLNVMALLIFPNATSSKSVSRVKGKFTRTSPWTWTRVTTEASSPIATKRGRLPSCPGNGWCARWWPWMYLPYLTRPELCVTQPWRQRDMTQLLPELCSCVDSRHSVRSRTPSTLRARQLSDSRHILIASEISLRLRPSSLNYFVRGTSPKPYPHIGLPQDCLSSATLADSVCYFPRTCSCYVLSQMAALCLLSRHLTDKHII